MWIKVEHTIGTKPEVFRIAGKLGISRVEAIGHLVSLWIWLDQNSESGELTATSEMVNALTLDGFAEALEEVGWLSVDKGKLLVPNYDRHNGSSAKKRALGAERVRKYRNAKSVTPVTNLVAKNLVLEKRREDKEKRKETWSE